MSISRAPLTEAGTSKSVRIKEGDLDLQLHYNEAGDGAETVIMLHGSGPGASGWANFSKNIEPFVEAGYRVILLDCPGWSKSDPIVCTGSRSNLNANAVKGFVNALGLDRVHLVGNSMGGHTAVAFALDNPERVGKLILMGGGTGGMSPFVPMPTEGIKLIQGVYRNPTIENLKKMMTVFVYDSSALTEELFQARLDNMLKQKEHLDNFVKSVDANPKQFPDFSHRLAEIKAQTLVIWGRNDRFVPMDTGLRLIAGIANSELHVFNACGHWAQWEHADKFNRMVLDFIKH